MDGDEPIVVQSQAPPSTTPPESLTPAAAGPPRRRRLARILLGCPQDPVWARPALIAIVVLTGLLCTWSLDTVGYGNTYYAAAATSGGSSWKAWFFGAFDPASFITIDKPPASIWVTGLSVRLFGLSPWSVLLPQALAGMATVLVLHHTVRRWFGAPAALMAAGAMALTPVAVVMFRHNNPDALLTLLLVAALASGFQAVVSGRARWLLGSFALAGLGFLTKTTQALLVVPALGLAYLVAAPVRLRRRLGHLALSVVVMVVAAGWWIAAVELTPDADRPYVGGTDTNSALEYALFGYNGIERLTSDNDSGPGGGFGGEAGWTRVFNVEVGGQVSWLVPAAALGLGAGLWASRRRRRGDAERAGWLLWGTAFLTQMAVFSFVAGVFHPYYTLTLAPVVAALAGAGTVVLWRAYRAGGAGVLLLPASLVLGGVWAHALLSRTPGFASGLGAVVLVVAATAAGALLLLRVFPSARALPFTAAAVGLAALLAGPTAYALDSISQAPFGGDPRAGPTVATTPSAITWLNGFFGRPPAGGDPPDRAPVPAGGFVPGAAGSAVETGLIDYLEENRGDATWLAATDGSQTAAAIILATREPAMAMGGFNGGQDPVPTPEQLAGYVESGQVRFLLLSPAMAPGRPGPGLPDRPPAGAASGGPGALPGGGPGAMGNRTEERRAWVLDNCRLVDPADYGGSSTGLALYDCVP